VPRSTSTTATAAFWRFCCKVDYDHCTCTSRQVGSDWDVQGQMLFNLFIYINIFGIVQTCANTLHGSNCEHQEGLLILVSWLTFWVLVNSWQSLDDSLRQSAGELLHSSTLGVPSDCIRSVYRRAVVGLDHTLILFFLPRLPSETWMGPPEFNGGFHGNIVYKWRIFPRVHKVKNKIREAVPVVEPCHVWPC